MALQTFTPPMKPKSGTKRKSKFKLKVAEFGDGYSQITRDGINHRKRTLSVEWDSLNPEQALAMELFFDNLGGDTPFLYTPTDESQPVKWLCSDYELTQDTPRVFTANFEQYFGPLT